MDPIFRGQLLTLLLVTGGSYVGVQLVFIGLTHTANSPSPLPRHPLLRLGSYGLMVMAEALIFWVMGAFLLSVILSQPDNFITARLPAITAASLNAYISTLPEDLLIAAMLATFLPGSFGLILLISAAVDRYQAKLYDDQAISSAERCAR